MSGRGKLGQLEIAARLTEIVGTTVYLITQLLVRLRLYFNLRRLLLLLLFFATRQYIVTNLYRRAALLMHLALRMRLREQLARRLTELLDLLLTRFSLLRIFNLAQIKDAFVRVRMEYVIVLETVLLASEDQVDPLVQTLGHYIGLEGLSMLLEERFSASLSPLRQLHVVHFVTVL